MQVELSPIRNEPSHLSPPLSRAPPKAMVAVAEDGLAVQDQGSGFKQNRTLDNKQI